MLGPLPIGYRFIVTVCTLVAFGGLGAWLAASLSSGSILAYEGLDIGLGIGAVVVVTLLFGNDRHEDHHGHAAGVRVQARRHRR